MSIAERHPFDFDALEKGTWIEAEQVERAAMCKRSDTAFRLRVMGLCQRIEEETGIMVRCDHDRIRLMDDAEATLHAQQRTGHHVRGLRRQAWRLAQVDVDKLSEHARAAHEHRLRSTCALSVAARSEFRKQERMTLLLGRGEPAE